MTSLPVAPAVYDDELTEDDGAQAEAGQRELQSAVAAEIRDAIDYGVHLKEDREKATRYYRGEAFVDDEGVRGRSLHVSTDVRDAVIGMMPPLMRIFMGSERIAEYVPVGPEDVQFAEQATALAHHVVTKQNPGFTILWSVFKDALLRKTGIVKWWHEEKITATESEFSGLDDAQVALLLQEPDVEPLELTQEVVTPETIGEDGQPVPAQVENRLRLRRVSRGSRYCVAAVPPEEFLIDRSARDIDTASMVGHRRSMTVSDLVALGYDEEAVLQHAGSGDEEFDFDEEVLARNPEHWGESNRNDPASRRVLYIEVWTRYDRDGDGVAELLRVCCIGTAHEILHVEGADEIPFSDFCPDPEPHAFIGQSEADKLFDIQESKSQLMRDMFDSLAQSIHPRTAVVEGQVSMADVMSVETGGIVRMRAPGMVQPLAMPFVGQQAFPMLEYLDTLKETRTGMSRASQGLNADSLQSSTRAAVAATISAAQGRIELVARIFAETGLKRLYRGLLRMFVRHQDRPMVVRMRGTFVAVDPRQWDADMDVEVNVALSATSSEDRVAVLAQIAAKQEMILQAYGPVNPMVSLAQYRNTLAKIAELSGFRDPSQFFSEVPPDWQPPQPPAPPPDPAQVLAQVEAEKIKASIATDAAKLELERQKASAADDRERDRIESDVMLRAREIELKYQQSVDIAEIKGMIDRDRELIRALQAESVAEMQAAQEPPQGPAAPVMEQPMPEPPPAAPETPGGLQ